MIYLAIIILIPLAIIILIPLILALQTTAIWLVWNGFADALTFRHIDFWTAMLIGVALDIVGSFFKGKSS